MMALHKKFISRNFTGGIGAAHLMPVKLLSVELNSTL
jgi:hypothetical protein